MIRECWRLPSQAEEAREGPPEAPEELQELKGKGSSKWNGFWAIFGLVLGSESGSWNGARGEPKRVHGRGPLQAVGTQRPGRRDRGSGSMYLPKEVISTALSIDVA